MTIVDPQSLEGQRRKDEAHAILGAHCQKQVLAGRRAFLSKLIETGKASADDVQAALKITDGVSPVYLGAVPKPFVKARMIERAGFAVSTRPKAHGRPVSLWRLIDRPAAEKWLLENPEPVRVEPTPPAPVSIPTTQPSLPGLEQVPSSMRGRK